MLHPDENDIDRRCGHGPTEVGRRYHRQAGVVEFSREGDTIDSAVKGSETIPCRQTIALSGRRGGVEIAGRCNCPMKTNCKHVAAALFHAMTLAQAAKTVAARSPEQRLTRLLGTSSTRADPRHDGGRHRDAARLVGRGCRIVGATCVGAEREHPGQSVS